MFFAVILLYYFIWLSIKIRYKEIAILRSMGMSKNKVRNLFLFESILLTIPITIISTIGSIIYSKIINKYLLASGLIQLLSISVTTIMIIFISVILVIVITSLLCLRNKYFSNLISLLRHE